MRKVFGNRDNSKKAENRTPSGKAQASGVDKRNLSLRNYSVVATIMFIVLALIVNIVFDQMLGNKLKWDWTGNKMYSIGDVTEEIIGSLKYDVELIGLFSEDSQYYSYYADLIPMLEEYVSKSNGKITLDFVDPDLNPELLKRIDPQDVVKPSIGSFVVFCETTGKLKSLSQGDLYSFETTQYYETVMTGIIAEQSLSGAIRYVQSETTPVIYFTSGHDEIDHASQYQTMVSLMTNSNYEVKSLELLGVETIPEDCTILIMADPRKDITANERGMIEEWLQKGGSLMIMSSFNTVEFSELNQLLEEFNIEISSDRLRDEAPDNQYQQDMYSMRANAPAGFITASAIDRYTLVLNARRINQLMNERDWVQVETVLNTSDQGVAEINGNTEETSAQAVQNIALLSEHSGWLDGDTVKDPARVLVYGSSDIFREDIIQAFGTNLYNPTLFYNSLSWLAGDVEDDNLMISPKVPVSYAITSGSSTTIVVTAVIVMLVLPLALLIMALAVYRKRKHL
ncbi:MAG: gliding motility-associatede transport system auxiliary component [Clostridiales bacterium]|jgi:hypothetical protein|nr:gliding motility-associatede transport system auxiliary component [Clostridiales bacterium]